MQTLQTRNDTAQQILDNAERLVQTRGYNSFSYADIAKTLKISKASLHYHFRSKADLGLRLIERYERNFLDALSAIDKSGLEDDARLIRYVNIYSSVLSENRMCLCGMLASEYETLPASMQAALKHFFDENEKWLGMLLQSGRSRKIFDFEGDAGEVAQLLISSLEGAMMIARSYGAPERFDSIARRLVADLGISPKPVLGGARGARRRR